MSALYGSPTGLDAFLRPRRVVLIGGSGDPAAISNRPARYLARLGFSGELTRVIEDPQSSIADQLRQMERPADVAMILLSATKVVDALSQVVEAGITRAIVIASGFEGELGRERRDQLLALLQRHPQLRLVGPNGNGVLSVESHTALCFSSVLLHDDPYQGTVSFVTQSGAIGNGIFFALQQRGLGVAHWFSTGDELSIGAVELATALVSERNRAVGLFLEGLTDAVHLPALADAIATTRKPVVALRAPQSEASKLAALAHTGRMLGDDHIGRASIEQAGVRLVDSVAELTDVLSLLSALPPHDGSTEPVRVGVLTVSGGIGVFAAEAISREEGLKLAQLDAQTRERLSAVLPGYLAIDNPLDVPILGDTALFVEALSVLRTSAACDAVIVVVSTLAHDYDQLCALIGRTGHPVVLTHLSPEERFSREQARRLASAGVASIPGATVAAKGLSIWAGAHHRRRVAAASGTAPVERAVADAPIATQLGLLGSAARLGRAVANRMPPMTPIATEGELEAIVAESEARFVVKADGAVLAHRTDVGAVRVGLSAQDPQFMVQAFRAVRAVCDPAGEAVVLQEMADPGVEVLLSVVRDRETGPVVLLRPGGVLVDLIDETVVLAGDEGQWAALVERSERVGRLLGGFRGAPTADTPALLALAADLRRAMRDDERIQGIECNPVLVHEKGRSVTVVDVITWVVA